MKLIENVLNAILLIVLHVILQRIAWNVKIIYKLPGITINILLIFISNFLKLFIIVWKSDGSKCVTDCYAEEECNFLLFKDIKKFMILFYLLLFLF